MKKEKRLNQQRIEYLENKMEELAEKERRESKARIGEDEGRTTRI